MPIDVHLLPEEVTVAIAIETQQLERLGLLLDPVNYTLSSGNMMAAELAVAKALNLYPKLTFRDTPHLISGRHATVEIIYSDKECKHYSVIRKDVGVYILVIGQIPDFRVVGYWLNEEIVKPQYILYHHVIHDIDQGPSIFPELLDDTRAPKGVPNEQR